MRLPLSLFVLACMLFLVGCVACSSLDPVPFNVTVDQPWSWKTEALTFFEFNFLTQKTSGLAVYTDLSNSNEFSSYSVPSSLNGHEILGVFQMDMRKVVLPPGGVASFSFTHYFSLGIMNVNPKSLVIVGLDVDLKKIVQIDFGQLATFAQRAILPLQTKVYTLGIMGIQREIPAQFGVPTLVNYRASLKYEIHKDLNQYLSICINRNLNDPSQEYVAKLVDNQIALPSNQMVEIASFSYNPMIKASKMKEMNGKEVEIDFQSLQCLYVMNEKEGFIRHYGSFVIPDWQMLGCDPGIGERDFFPKYITIVANRGSTPPPNPPQPVTSNVSPQPIASKAPQPIISKVPQPIASKVPQPIISPNPNQPLATNSSSNPIVPTYSSKNNAHHSRFPRNAASMNVFAVELIIVVVMTVALLF